MSNLKNLFDKNNRRSWFNDIKQDIITEFYYNNLPENFEAIVLSGTPYQTNAPNAAPASSFLENNDGRYYFVRIRPLMSIENIIPDPFAETEVPRIRKLINMHPIAYIAVNDTTHPPTHGDIFQCRYTRNDKLGFELVDRLRDSGKSVKQFDNRSINQQFSTLVPNLYRESPEYQREPPEPEISEGKILRGSFNWNIEELRELAEMGIFEPLLHYIREHECSTAGCATRHFDGDQYDAFNYSGGNKIGSNRKLGKRITTLTIAEVRGLQINRQPNLGGSRVLAAGAYQIIPNTFKKAINRIKGLNTGELYDKRNQDPLGIYLVTTKRPSLGKYLFGGNVSYQTAGNQLAFEFASIPLQKDAQLKTAKRDNNGKKIKDANGETVYYMRKVYKYYRAYGGVGANKAGKKDVKGTQEAQRVMKQVRDSIANNPRAIELGRIALERE